MDSVGSIRKIIVKTPLSTDGKDDFTMDIQSNWTVRQLKDSVARDSLTKPKVDDMKLIFSGCILSDHAFLRDCFRSVAPGTCPVVHLVCKPISPVIPSVAASTSASNPQEDLRRRDVPLAVPAAQPGGSDAWTPQAAAALPTYDQAYMAQYYQNYQAYVAQYMYSQMVMNSAMAPDVSFAHLPNGTPGGIGANIIRMNQPGGFGVANHAGVAEMQAGPGAGGAGHQQVVMNAQGGAAIVEGEGEQRDAFDMAYMGFRLVALLCAIYFSSSTSRFFSAFTMLSIFLLFNTIRDFRRWRERHMRRNAEAGQEPMGNPVPVDGQVGGQALPGEPHAENAASAVPEPVAVEPGLFSTVFTLVAGFFTSLVPDINNVLA